MLDEYLMTVCTLLIGILLLPALLSGRAAAFARLGQQWLGDIHQPPRVAYAHDLGSSRAAATCADISADDRARWAVLDTATRHRCRSRLRSIPGHHVEVSALG